ncbi:hypothetical protein, partial [Zobellia nedashkovskayae]
SNAIPININYKNDITNLSQNQLCLDFYNRLLVSTNIIKFTNKSIDTKAKTRNDVPSAIWDNVKQGIDYSSFINDVTNIICDNYTVEYMTAAIAEYVNRPYIKISSGKVKKEMYDSANNFTPVLEQQIQQILSDNGY